MKVKNLQVQVTYNVEYGDVEMPKAVFNELKNFDGSINEHDMVYGRISSETADWLIKNTSERDAHIWQYLIESIG